MRVRFVSRNRHKIREVSTILAASGIDVVPVDAPLDELQSPDVDVIVRDKCLKAFALVGRPVIVEHTSLHLDALNGLPGGLTQVFWDRLEADRMTRLFGGPASDSGATATTVVGYCDGERVRSFKGELRGAIAAAPAGPRDFQWDCVFVPDGEALTLAEMGDRKDALSMRRRALEGLLAHLAGRRVP